MKLHFHNEEVWRAFLRDGGPCPRCETPYGRDVFELTDHIDACAPVAGRLVGLGLDVSGKADSKVVKLWLPFAKGEAACPGPGCNAVTPYRWAARVAHMQLHGVTKANAKAIYLKTEIKGLGESEPWPEGSVDRAEGREVEEAIPFEGRKDDAGKLRWSLLPLRAMKSVVEVLEYGARKYSEGGWKSVSRQRYVEAAFRHMVAVADGEKLDAESGLPHAAHTVCCMLFIIHFDGEKP